MNSTDTEDPADPFSERHEHLTPHGGVASEAFYHDGKFNRLPRSMATHVEIVEYDSAGNAIFRTHGHTSRYQPERDDEDSA